MTVVDEVSSLCNKPISKASLTKCAWNMQGSRLACAALDGVIHTIKTPVYGNQVEHLRLLGHNQRITDMDWSSNGQLLLTTSADKSAYMWSMAGGNRGAKLVCIDTLIRNKHGKAMEGNVPFDEEIRAGQFYYCDKIVMLACGPNLHFYKYEL